MASDFCSEHDRWHYGVPCPECNPAYYEGLKARVVKPSDKPAVEVALAEASNIIGNGECIHQQTAAERVKAVWECDICTREAIRLAVAPAVEAEEARIEAEKRTAHKLGYDWTLGDFALLLARSEKKRDQARERAEELREALEKIIARHTRHPAFEPDPDYKIARAALDGVERHE